jgi:hypothetical protein
MNESTPSTENKYQDHQVLRYGELLKNGLKAEFHDGDNHIVAWGGISGKERIELNGQVVSEKRNLFKRSCLHTFEDLGVLYEVEINAVNMMTGEIHFILIKEGVHVETKKLVICQPFNKKPTTGRDFWRQFAVYFVLGFVVGFTTVHYFVEGEWSDTVITVINAVSAFFS